MTWVPTMIQTINGDKPKDLEKAINRFFIYMSMSQIMKHEEKKSYKVESFSSANSETAQ